MDVFAGIRFLAKSADLLKWHKVAEVLVPGVYRIGEIDDTDGCERLPEWQTNCKTASICRKRLDVWRGSLRRGPRFFG